MTDSRFVGTPVPHYEVMMEGRWTDVYPAEFIEYLLDYLERKADENRSIA